jgi:nitrate/TMAO reductase-like tetraheme cytochrome c subunit
VAGTSPGRQRQVRIAWIAAVIVAAAIVLLAGLTSLTASPQLCGSCHEMAPAVADWKISSHADIGCPACHETPRPWYMLPVTLADRAAMLSRDLHAHRTMSAEQIAIALRPSTTAIPESRCLQCHSMSRKITLHFGTLIQHAKHAARNKSCTSCHLATGHPDPVAERPLVLMTQCFTCHGRAKNSKAPGTCDECHPKSFSRRPDSHSASDWRIVHGQAFLKHVQPCYLCHEQMFCNNCHGLQMPHPSTWVRGKPGHSTVGAADPQLCTRCHQSKPNVCSMCHHQGLATSGGSWVQQHPAIVSKKGASFCMNCHTPVFCFDCHITGATTIKPGAE